MDVSSIFADLRNEANMDSRTTRPLHRHTSRMSFPTLLNSETPRSLQGALPPNDRSIVPQRLFQSPRENHLSRSEPSLSSRPHPTTVMVEDMHAGPILLPGSAPQAVQSSKRKAAFQRPDNSDACALVSIEDKVDSLGDKLDALQTKLEGVCSAVQAIKDLLTSNQCNTKTLLLADSAHVVKDEMAILKEVILNIQKCSSGNASHRRQIEVLGLICGGCELSALGKCSVAVAWAVSMRHKVKGANNKNGSLLGLHVTDCLKNPEPVLSFFPSREDLFNAAVCPVIKDAAKYVSLQCDDEHIYRFYSKHFQVIEAEVLRRLDTTMSTRKSELINSFKHKEGRSIDISFGSAQAIDSGSYRREINSRVSDPRFLHSVRAAFRLAKGKVGLEQLAFASVVLVNNFHGSHSPTMHQIVAKGDRARYTDMEKREMHMLMCSSLAVQLNAQCSTTSFGWKTDNLEIYRPSASTLHKLEDFTVKLAGRLV